jgi:hypothetical protein
VTTGEPRRAVIATRTIAGLVLTLVPAAAFAEPRGTYRVTPAEHYAASEDAPLSRILYVNRCAGGCTIYPGVNDARADSSSVPDQVSTLNEFMHDDQVWDDTLSCLRQVWEPYDLDVVTEDPGDVPHHEAILAGLPEELGLPATVAGVAPLAGDCSAQNNVISFTFANRAPPAWIELCWTVAQESAHAFGLDHAFDCADPMTYLPNCGQKFFRDRDLPCGEFEARPCQCGGDTQNSHQTLLALFGPGTLPDPPELTLLRPEDGAEIDSRLVVEVAAAHVRGIGRIEFRINGWPWGWLPGHPYLRRQDTYLYGAPDELPDGVIDLEVRAFNDLGGSTSAFVTVIKGAPCTASSQCASGQICDRGRCLWPQSLGLGEACERDMDCASAVCGVSGQESLCTQLCDPMDSDCPAGFACLPAADRGACWPVDRAAGGCCSSAGSRRPPVTAILMVVAMLGLVLRSRRDAARRVDT